MSSGAFVEGKAEAMVLSLTFVLYGIALDDFCNSSIDDQVSFGRENAGLDGQSVKAAMAFLMECRQRLQAAFESSE